MKALQCLEQFVDDLARIDPIAHFEAMQCLVELRPYFAPSDEFPAPADSAHFMAWAKIVDVMHEVRPDWNTNGFQSPRDNAVAAIRSMAAQCSAQPAPAIPIAWPEPVTPEQMDALVFANGFMRGHGFDLVSDQLAAVIGWLRTNGCAQIR